MSFKDKQILITGGAGFIGSNLALRLVREGARVTVLDAMLPECGGNLFNLNPVMKEIDLKLSDMRDWQSLTSLVCGKDYIFNLAGQVGHQYSMDKPVVDMDINVKAQLLLLEACRRFNKDAVVVYTSTRQLYGCPQYLPVDEKHPLNPPDVNGINKLAAEQYHSLYSKIYGIRAVSLRLTNTYGPRQFIKNSRQGFMGWFINRVLTGEAIQLFGGGDQVRDFNYVDDVIEALLAAALSSDCYGKVYNLSGERKSVRYVAEKLIEVFGSGNLQIIPFPEEQKKIDIGDFYGTSELLFKDSGWTPQIGIDEGLQKTLEFYEKYKDYYLGGKNENSVF